MPTDSAPESHRESTEEYYYIPNHTEGRPPQFINENLSSAQPNASNTQPRRARSIETDNTMSDFPHVTDGGDGNYTYLHYTPSTAYTESTMRAGDPFVARPDLAYVVNYNYYSDGGNGGGLTAQAIAALDHDNANGYYGGVNGREEPYRVGYNYFHADSGYDLSTSHMMPSSGPRSKASTTTNNYVLVSSTPEDPSADMVRSAGSWLDDIPASHASLASDIADEDVTGA
ncbi:uncharacterized protein F4807DRAFT_106209 [Annulohypoxylon truncatum]|uniref:uncharacterized protein n=1 Tax=Annulohypoxylon truncatum TaxID=327061 RepID=UPI0020078978|nr:uncharacterized protein F4807DRAFT_106209 [Annulohypoxylon truncatum]KAI1208987.1 hypothetical protein F4807DRAFT_106209 [Annulohypoxylon truncatum]